MKAWLAILALIPLAGCARFPASGAQSQFTRVKFTIRFRGPVNTAQDDTPLTNGLYYVAMRATTDPNPLPQTAPVPVFAQGSPNGFVAGSPTHFVRFQAENPLASYPYVLYRFAPGPGPGDPNNDVNLASFFDQTSNKGPIVNFGRPSDGDPNTLQFDVFVDQLADNATQAQALTKLQVNILTMNRLTTQGSGDRIGDSLGDSLSPSGNAFVTVDLRSSNTVRNNGLEPANDTFGGTDSTLDIVDFTIEVIRP